MPKFYKKLLKPIIFKTIKMKSWEENGLDSF